MASSIEICNMALGFLGQDPITNLLDPQNAQEQLCAQYYDVARRSVLEEVSWSFAMRRIIIEGETSTPQWGYANRHILPADTLRVIFVGQQDDERKYNKFDWRFEDGAVLTDPVRIFVRYLADVVDTTRFSSLFVQCLAARLAVDMCIAITENRALRLDLDRTYEEKLRMAATMDSMQGRSEKFKTGQLTNSRQGGNAFFQR